MGKKDGSPVLVNDDVYLFNQWNNNGGYLDTRGYQKDFEKTGNHLCVSTATASNRDMGSGTWKILSATGSAAGTPVTENAEIHLQNGWNKFAGGYLDTRGYQKDFEKTGNHLCVSTATVNNRDTGSGTWKITLTTKKTLALPDKFKVHAFSVNQGAGKQPDYWFGMNNNDSRGRILNDAQIAQSGKMMQIETVSLGNNQYAFKVINAGEGMYLTARENLEVRVDRAYQWFGARRSQIYLSGTTYFSTGCQ